MKKFGDVVVYVRGDVSVAALVLQSRMIAESHPDKLAPGEVEEPVQVEHLTLKYLDPAYASSAMSGGDMDKAVATAFDAVPLTGDKTNGWKGIGEDRIEGSGMQEYDPEADARANYAKDQRIDELEAQVAAEQAEVAAQKAENDELKDGIAKAASEKPVVADTAHALANATHVPLDDVQRASLNEGYAVRCAVYADGSTVTGVPPLPATNQGDWKKVDEADHEEYIAKQKSALSLDKGGADSDKQ